MPATYKRNPGQERMRKLFTSGARYNLVYGGSRSGKTFEAVGTIVERALFAPRSRHLIVRKEANSAKRAIVLGTMPEVIAARWPGLPMKWSGEFGYWQLPNDSEIWVGGLNDAKAMERLLGNEYVTIYENEASEIPHSAHTLLRTRLAQTVETIEGRRMSQRVYVDLNPTTRNHWTYRTWRELVDPDSGTPLDRDQYGYTTVNPMDNAENLSAEYLTDLRSMSARARKRFYDGEYVEDVEDALWRRELIRRVKELPDLARVVVAVDPAVSNTPGSDETGIIAAAVDRHGMGYVLEDASGRYGPAEWARQAIALYDIWSADRIVGEVNQGGDMVEYTLRSMRSDIPFRAVRASRGKVTRAEPVSALYERRKVLHAEEFPALEDQMCSMTTGMDRTAAGYSPDRVDALVWAMTDLFPQLAVSSHVMEDEDEYEFEGGRNAVTGY